MCVGNYCWTSVSNSRNISWLLPKNVSESNLPGLCSILPPEKRLPKNRVDRGNHWVQCGQLGVQPFGSPLPWEAWHWLSLLASSQYTTCDCEASSVQCARMKPSFGTKSRLCSNRLPQRNRSTVVQERRQPICSRPKRRRFPCC